MAQYKRQLSFGERWFYKFKLNGILYRSKAIYLTKAEAKKAENNTYQQADQKQRNISDSQDVNLLEAINNRLDYIKSRKSVSYYNENRRYLSKLLDAIGDKPIRSITKHDIEPILAMASERLGIGRKGHFTVNAMLRCYKALFNFTGDYNPCNRIQFYPVDKKLKFIPTNAQIQEVYNRCTPEQRDLIRFILDTGARINEALQLKGRDISHTTVTLYTRKSNNSDLVPRQVPKPDCLNGKKFKPDEFIFSTWSGIPKFLKRKIVRLKQPIWGFHSLRHRRASIWSKQRKPLFEIMSLLGHSQITTTQIYLRMLPEIADSGDTLVTLYGEMKLL